MSVREWRRKRTGTENTEVARAVLQGQAFEGEEVVVYAGPDGDLLARVRTDFDRKFEEVFR